MEGSAKRHSLFIDVQQKLASERDHSKPQTLKSLSTTRWSARTDNCRALLESLPSVIETLEQIQTGDRFDKESSGTAMALSKAIDFEFCLHLVALSKILSVTGVLSRYLQKEDMDISTAALLVEDCGEQLVSMRSDDVFEGMWTETVKLASKINIEFQENKRARKVSKRLDDRWQSQTLLGQKDETKVSFCFATLDLAIQSITDRFSSETLPLLKHTLCLTKPSTENVPHLKYLWEFFIGDVNVITAEVKYRMFIHRLEREEQRPSSLMDIFIYMVEKKYLMAHPELRRLYQLIITLPVPSCSNERCFSSLKLIKNRLRTTMSQDRMSDLKITAVEADRTQSVNLETVRDAFWRLGERQCQDFLSRLPT
uniref:HAT C-terminal dimerisation domain-containing protein n=1 Tax=Cyprinus carpio TaxID=7962 RepID=A0A8C1U6P6_CYPCA